MRTKIDVPKFQKLNWGVYSTQRCELKLKLFVCFDFNIIVMDADDAGGTERCEREGRSH
jgi:hypothetical protein